MQTGSMCLETVVSSPIVVPATLLCDHICVVLFQPAKILSCFFKFSLLHTMLDILMYIRSIAVHYVIPFRSLFKLSADSNIVAHHGGAFPFCPKNSRPQSWQWVLDKCCIAAVC